MTHDFTSCDQSKQISTSNEYDTLLGELKAQNDEVSKQTSSLRNCFIT